MFQGTGSDVGKSLLVAGLCRLLAKRGLKVAPFKAQNMSNNAAVADDGGEIGRAQWLQALAAEITPSVHMNPVLLKPQSDKTSQVIVRGKLTATMDAKEYQQYRKSLLPQVLESYNFLAKDADIVLVEGAGSPAEINLRENDIANMGFARAANIPVVLIGDIERGGVIASLVGTHAVLSDADREMIRGFIVNKFRGDASLFTAGAKEITTRTGWKNLGVVPHFAELAKLPQEDSLALSSVIRHPSSSDGLHIAVLHTPHIANFDDINPLANDPNINLSWIKSGEVIPADADIVILAGSKSTIADLKFIRAQGWDIDLQAHRRRGGRIIGICGGYQMLGKTISDPHGVEGAPETASGLGFLDVYTILTTEKTVRNISATGYEIHAGETTGAATSDDGLVWGSYVHGLFADDEFRNNLFKINSNYNYRQHVQKILDDWADVLEENINIEQLLKLAK
jgi:adenosylcobyric acid synthase